jgi:hypothetical protein
MVIEGLRRSVMVESVGYFVNEDGAYAGCFQIYGTDHAGLIQVTEAPQHTLAVWNFDLSVWENNEVSVPNFIGFRNSILDDPNIPVESKLSLITFLPSVESFLSDPDRLQAGWAMLKAASLPWLPLELVQLIEASAVSHSIALVAPDQ